MTNTFRIPLVALGVIFLAAGCNPLAKNNSAGLIKTNNGGANWVPANAVAGQPKQSLVSLNISVLEFDPSSSGQLYAASYTGGLYKSTDSGSSWTPILSRIAVYDVAVSPKAPNILFAGGYAVGHGKLLRSSDGGKTWEEMYNEETPENAVRAVALNPENPSEVVIGLTSGNVVKSYDAGKNWVLVKNFEDRVNRIRWINNKLYMSLRTKGLYVSSDQALNWKNITDSILKQENSGGVFFQNQSAVSSFSQFAVNPTDDKEIYITTGNGLFKTNNEGSSWTRLNIPIQNKNTQVRGVAIAPSNTKIVYASAGSTVYKTLDGGVSFQTQGVSTQGFINYILVDPALPQNAYAGVFQE